MSKGISFTSIDFSKHPEMIQMDGHNVFALKYECKHAKLYVSYASIKRSLDYCLNNICYINAHREKTGEPFVNENITAHSTSMIAHYGRCFASGRVKLERSNVPKASIKTHDKLIKLRNEYIAHSGGSGEATMNLVGLYPSTENRKVVYISVPIFATVNYINEPFLHETQNIVMHLQSYVEDKLKFHYEKIVAEVLAVNVDDLYAEFDKFNLAKFEYNPKISPGNYNFSVEVKQDGRVFVKGLRK